MRILMLGNSFTEYNNLPGLLAERTGAEVAAHTRGGARLSEQYNAETELGRRTLKALREERWDYVVLQEMSRGPSDFPNAYLRSADTLCALIQRCGAVPVIYATWAYRKDGERLKKCGLNYDGMYRKLTETCRLAAERNGALLAEVGTAFYNAADPDRLYAEDDYHPSLEGSILAAEVIAGTILNS